ncbi:acid-sensing ion channel 4-A-like [Daphnia pulex]|uniref:acid-sensing ion channel 4-A-like n=1 Tax=Daphnia pulex TaxID=6669 RepID=UPI001EE1349D|nr:acid-sensing ion channel 4-A-like [Daphnia pulex]
MFFIEDNGQVGERFADAENIKTDNQKNTNLPPSRPSAGISAAVPDLQETMCMLQMMSVDGPLAELKPKPALSAISMPGIANIFGEAHLTRRIVWILVIVSAFIIATIQVKDRVEFYSSTPVTVNVRVTMNDTLRFPVLTICNKNSFNMSQIRMLEAEAGLGRNSKSEVNISQLVGVRGMDAKQLWDVIAHDPDQIIAECWFGRNVSCNQVGRWTKVYTYLGVCYSFIRNETWVKTTGSFNNLYVKLKDTEMECSSLLWGAKKGEGERGWKMLIHDLRDSPVVDVRTHGSTLDNGWGKDIRIYLREFRTLNVWKRPCLKNGNYSKCIERCFVAAAADRMTCRLPFMDEIAVGYNHRKMEYCNTPDSFWNNSKEIDNLLVYGHWARNSCSHCQRQCNQDFYIAYTEMTKMKPSENKISKLRVFYQDFTFDEIEESADYGAVSLLCDIGGSLGFLLGFSVLTVCEIVDAIVQTCLSSTRRLIKKCRGMN